MFSSDLMNWLLVMLSLNICSTISQQVSTKINSQAYVNKVPFFDDFRLLIFFRKDNRWHAFVAIVCLLFLLFTHCSESCKFYQNFYATLHPLSKLRYMNH